MLPSIPLSSVIFKKPASGSGAVVEMLAKNGEEIMISEPGTPDPVIFTGDMPMAFFRELGFFSGAHDELVLDTRHYRPAGFGFMQGRSRAAFGDIRNWLESGEVQEMVDEAPASLEQSQFTTTIYTLDDAFPDEEFSVDEIAQEGLSHLEDGAVKEVEEAHYIGERYLTTPNLTKLTIGLVIMQFVLIFILPPPIEAIKDALYICVGSMIVLALSFIFFEKRNPDHSSLRIRRYIWLCLIVFNISMLLAYVMAGRVMMI
ncbi:hypothetical protein NB640_10845 [Oxalobacter vibrioformis]|uniref:Uncharacterized protein n=1 Tax=Oxalobacter vibrioformis TaxID=933080 RepID=A0A9E9LV38_9BURK|nr:hypothetical protein [Oxalobacter vibrioformis]WAW09711.1 hypothetical protein NB640_10845 [Oxalobacter vibrioformis]